MANVLYFLTTTCSGKCTVLPDKHMQCIACQVHRTHPGLRTNTADPHAVQNLTHVLPAPGPARLQQPQTLCHHHARIGGVTEAGKVIIGKLEQADGQLQKRAYMMQLILVRFCCWTGVLLKQVPARGMPQAPSTRLQGKTSCFKTAISAYSEQDTDNERPRRNLTTEG